MIQFRENVAVFLSLDENYIYEFSFSLEIIHIRIEEKTMRSKLVKAETERFPKPLNKWRRKNY